MGISTSRAIAFSIALLCAFGVTADAQKRRRGLRAPTPTQRLSQAAQREADWIRSMSDDDKTKILKAAENLRYLLHTEQKGDYESFYFWAAYDSLTPKAESKGLSEVGWVTRQVLADGSQVAKLMDETGYILKSAKDLVDYKTSPYDIAPSLGIYDRITRDELEKRMLGIAEQKMAIVFKILKAAGVNEN